MKLLSLKTVLLYTEQVIKIHPYTFNVLIRVILSMYLICSSV